MPPIDETKETVHSDDGAGEERLPAAQEHFHADAATPVPTSLNPVADMENAPDAAAAVVPKPSSASPEPPELPNTVPSALQGGNGSADDASPRTPRGWIGLAVRRMRLSSLEKSLLLLTGMDVKGTVEVLVSMRDVVFTELEATSFDRFQDSPMYSTVLDLFRVRTLGTEAV